MKRTKNEIRERNGKIIFVISILFPILLFGGYYAWIWWNLRGLKESIVETAKRSSENRYKKRQQRDKELLYRGILGNGQESAYTGIELKDSIQHAYAIQIRAIDSISFRYRIERLIDWKSLSDINGVASIDKNSLGNRQWTIKKTDEDYFNKSAFRFIDNQECEIEILITKEYFIDESIVKVNRTCGRKKEDLTMIMNYK